MNQAIQTLRKETQAGIMDCKNAIIQANGNIERAMELLLDRGGEIAEKKTERVAADGVAYAVVINHRAVLVEVNTETDFVAENKEFLANIRRIAETIAHRNPDSVEALLQCVIWEEDDTVEVLLHRMTLAFREKIVLRRFASLDTPMPIAYTHQNGQYGVILALSTGGSVPEKPWESVGKELALQIAASAPKYIARERIRPEERLSIEAAIVEELDADAGMSNKPPQIKEKILSGRIEKFYRTNCLLEQPYIKSTEQTVAEYLQSATSNWDFPVTITEFVRYQKAEGLQETDGQSNLEYARELSKDSAQ